MDAIIKQLNTKNPLFLRIMSSAILIPIIVGLIWGGIRYVFPLSLLILLGLYREITRATLNVTFSIFSFVHIVLPLTAFLYPQMMLETLIFTGCIMIVGGYFHRHHIQRFIWCQVTATYATLAMLSVCLLSAQHQTVLILWSVMLVILSDSGAYFIGSKMGGPKLAPKISPSKTWSGFMGGIIFGTLGALAFQNFINIGGNFAYPFIICTLILCITSHMGDLLESIFKRKFDIKDSGSLIPGHGGLLDRLDSILLVMLVLPMLLK